MNNICQSCGMPMQKDEDFGINLDASKNKEYCKYCYKDGKFTAQMTLSEFIEKQIQISVQKLHLSESDARTIANNVLPSLKRWKK